MARSSKAAATHKLGREAIVIDPRLGHSQIVK